MALPMLSPLQLTQKNTTAPTYTQPMSESQLLDRVPMGLSDPMFDLKVRTDADTSVAKIDLGIGIYRGEDTSKPFVLSAITQSKAILYKHDPGHEYELTTGNPVFTSCAAELMFGAKCSALQGKKIATTQTVSGTSANHLGAVFARKFLPPPNDLPHTVYIGTPAWGNYKPLFEHAGFQVVQYKYYDEIRHEVDFVNIMETLRRAPARSLIVLQGCCHNPTGADLTRPQWVALADIMRSKSLVPFFDVAYQGLGKGMDEDAWATTYFVKAGFEMLVCQSFSKHMGLYGERVGALHVVTKSDVAAACCLDQLRSLVRWTFSSSPAYGSRLATIVMTSPELYQAWQQELSQMRERLRNNRAQLHRLLVGEYHTPGNWDHILSENGLFHFTGLSPQQVEILANEYHIYLPSNGRVNIAGLNRASIPVVAAAFDRVARDRAKTAVRRVNLAQPAL